MSSSDSQVVLELKLKKLIDLDEYPLYNKCYTTTPVEYIDLCCMSGCYTNADISGIKGRMVKI